MQPAPHICCALQIANSARLPSSITLFVTLVCLPASLLLPAALRILRGVPQIINGGRFFDKEGNRVPQPGERYAANGVRLQLPQAPER